MHTLARMRAHERIRDSSHVHAHVCSVSKTVDARELCIDTCMDVCMVLFIAMCVNLCMDMCWDRFMQMYTYAWTCA